VTPKKQTVKKRAQPGPTPKQGSKRAKRVTTPNNPSKAEEELVSTPKNATTRAKAKTTALDSEQPAEKKRRGMRGHELIAADEMSHNPLDPSSSGLKSCALVHTTASNASRRSPVASISEVARKRPITAHAMFSKVADAKVAKSSVRAAAAAAAAAAATTAAAAAALVPSDCISHISPSRISRPRGKGLDHKLPSAEVEIVQRMCDRDHASIIVTKKFNMEIKVR
jgi:hypothetical protein